MVCNIKQRPVVIANRRELRCNHIISLEKLIHLGENKIYYKNYKAKASLCDNILRPCEQYVIHSFESFSRTMSLRKMITSFFRNFLF